MQKQIDDANLRILIYKDQITFLEEDINKLTQLLSVESNTDKVGDR